MQLTGSRTITYKGPNTRKKIFLKPSRLKSVRTSSPNTNREEKKIVTHKIQPPKVKHNPPKKSWKRNVGKPFLINPENDVAWRSCSAVFGCVGRVTFVSPRFLFIYMCPRRSPFNTSVFPPSSSSSSSFFTLSGREEEKEKRHYLTGLCVWINPSTISIFRCGFLYLTKIQSRSVSWNVRRVRSCEHQNKKEKIVILSGQVDPSYVNRSTL